MINPKLIRSASIFLIWLFCVSGILGILYTKYADWFISMTPLNLGLYFIILIANSKNFKPNYIIAFTIPFVLGFVTETLGVNYGLIFGNYTYGQNLGYKFFGVPIVICLNWALLTATTADITNIITRNIWLSSFMGGVLMTALDVLLEISAPHFDFWEFENGVVPIQNYIGWLVTAFFAHLGYQYFRVKTDTLISWHIFISIIVFFSVFIFFN